MCMSWNNSNNYNNMHGAAIKIIDAQQARLYNSYKNTKRKLLRTNPAVWFNKMCKLQTVMTYVRPHTVQTHNERTSTEFNLVTA